MAYKPSQAASSGAKKSFTPRTAPNGKPYLFPVPEAGNQAARISLIVDVGTQEREDFVDGKTGESKPQKPAQQLVIFADLVDQVVDYGGDIGMRQYRLMLNKNFKGAVAGINFGAVPPRDADGKLIEGRLWTWHPQSPLTKLAKATGNEKLLGQDEENNMDIEQLLAKGFYADVEVKVNTSDKKDAKGEAIVFTNVNFKGASKLPMVKGKALEIDELQVEPMILNHNNVTAETLVFIRGKVLEMMKLAKEYPGSVLQGLLVSSGEDASAPAKAQAEEPKKAAPAPASAKATDAGVDFDAFDADSDEPF